MNHGGNKGVLSLILEGFFFYLYMLESLVSFHIKPMHEVCSEFLSYFLVLEGEGKGGPCKLSKKAIYCILSQTLFT